MNVQQVRPSLLAIFAALWMLFAGCSASSGASNDDEVKVKLTGDQEVPPVKTSASGSGTFVIAADKSVSGSITTTGIEGTAAHIHDSTPGDTMCGAKNGPVIIPLTKGANNTWTAPAGAKLTDAQYQSFKAGNLYVNVHSAANKGGEICSRLK
jgi:hypothetical protein